MNIKIGSAIKQFKKDLIEFNTTKDKNRGLKLIIYIEKKDNLKAIIQLKR